MVNLKTYLLNKQFSNLIVYGFGQGFNLITPLLVIPYIVLICGEEGYGKIGVGMAIAFFIMVFIDYGSEITGVQQIAINRKDKTKLETIFITTYTAKLILLFIVLLVVSILFYFIPYFSQDKKLYFFSLSMVVGQFINPTWFLQGIENFKWITIINILSKVIYLAGIFIFINKPSDFIYCNLIWGVGMIVANLIAFFYILQAYSFSFATIKKETILKFVKDNFSIFSSQVFVSLQMYSPIVLISFFGGNTMAGQYKIIDQIIVIFKTYILLFFNFVYPRVCYLLYTSKKEALRFWKTYNGLNFIFIAFSMLMIYLFSIKVVTYFNPKGIEEICSLLKIAVMIPILQAITIPLKQLVLGTNRQSRYVRITMLITIMSLILIVVITPIYKVFGVLIALILTEIITSLIFYFTVKNDLFVRSS
jgi:O-antigen/teichoic acid export membrane protein